MPKNAIQKAAARTYRKWREWNTVNPLAVCYEQLGNGQQAMWESVANAARDDSEDAREEMMMWLVKLAQDQRDIEFSETTEIGERVRAHAYAEALDWAAQQIRDAQ